MEYASPVCDPHTKRNTNKIEVAQRMCARYVTGNFDRTSSVISLLNCLSCPTLEERRRQYRLAVMYRILHNQVDIHWQPFLTKNFVLHKGSQQPTLCAVLLNHVYASSFFPRTSKDWNNPSFDPADAPYLHTIIRKRDDNAYISFFPFLMLFCFVLTSLRRIQCVYVQTFEAALILEEKEKRLVIDGFLLLLLLSNAV